MLGRLCLNCVLNVLICVTHCWAFPSHPTSSLKTSKRSAQTRTSSQLLSCSVLILLPVRSRGHHHFRMLAPRYGCRRFFLFLVFCAGPVTHFLHHRIPLASFSDSILDPCASSSRRGRNMHRIVPCTFLLSFLFARHATKLNKWQIEMQPPVSIPKEEMLVEKKEKRKLHTT